MSQGRRFLPALPTLAVLVMLGPVAAGLWGTILPAFGHLPAAGLTVPNLAPFQALFTHPGLSQSVYLSVMTGVASTVISLAVVIMLSASWSGTRVFRGIERFLSPLLSVPHAAAAFGLAFLIAPSGWIARALSPWLTGWERPLDLLIVNDKWGLALIAGMVVKEVPFLLLMTLAALGQTQARRRIIVCQTLGYGRTTGWLKSVFPSVYAQIRLPVYVVLAYAMSVVDVAIILGPNTPPPLSVQIVKWMSDPDIAMRTQAAAAAILQLALVLVALGVWRVLETVVAKIGRIWIASGTRGAWDPVVSVVALVAGSISGAAVFLGIFVLAVWSIAGFWGFPDALPNGFTLGNWERHLNGVSSALGQTALIAIIVTTMAVFLTIGCLEAEYRYDLQLGQRGIWLLYLPLLVPQTAFLPGFQTLLLGFGANVGLIPVIIAHMVFVLPYVFLSLAVPFRAWDARLGVVGATLGAGPDRLLWTVRLPMLVRPLLTAIAVGLAVSVGQYLATLLMGGGRIATLTTEAVALASGGDRRAIGVYGLMQTLAALVPFTIAIVVPALLWRNRKGLQNG